MSSPNATASAVSGQDVTLSTILAGPYRMTYAIPLLIISIPLALAGSFLTLDRTRSFIPKNALKKGKWRLEGGIGGIAAGWVFGVHLSTFLALLIMNRTSASPLGPVHFLVIWVLSAASLSVVSGRWKVATLIFLGITGGTSLSLLLSVVMSPKITARLILLAVLTPINTACCLVPVLAVQHGAARFSAAITGSFGIILSAAQLGQAESWANVWMRLWIAKDADWGNSVEKGLSAAMCILCLIGITCDWLLKRRYGENPDQKWDSYLASYAENIPNGSDRAGSFTPSVPFWKKVFGAQSKSRPILFPSDSTLRGTPFKSKLRSKKSTHAKRFRPIKDEFMSGSSSESEGDNTEPNPRPWAKRSSTTLSGATLLGAGAGKGKLKPIDDYSDGESVRTREKPIPPGTPGWRPAFFMRHASSSHRGSFDLEQGNNPIVQSESPKSMSGHLPAPVGGVPATPSLIRAIDRLALAQSEAYGTPHPRPVATPDGSSSGDHWKPFWQEVRDKAEGTDSVQTPR